MKRMAALVVALALFGYAGLAGLTAANARTVESNPLVFACGGHGHGYGGGYGGNGGYGCDYQHA